MDIALFGKKSNSSAFIFLDTAGAASMVQVCSATQKLKRINLLQTYREMSARNIRVYYAAARGSFI